MKDILIIISISILAFIPIEKKAEFEIMEIMKRVNNEDFELKKFRAILKEKYCSKILFKTDEGLECQLAKSVSKNFNAKSIHVTSEPTKLNTQAICLVFLGYSRNDEKAEMMIENDFEMLANELKKEFSLVNEINNADYNGLR